MNAATFAVMLDWDDLRVFLIVARHGSLSAAARELRISQPTVSRRIDAFERKLGTKVFARRSSALRLSAAGEKLLGHAERMEEESLAAERVATGRDAGVSGVVRVTASEWLVMRVLAPMFASFAREHRGLTIELVADHRHLNLVRGDADVALRPRRFEQDSVHQRAVARVGFALYASVEYRNTDVNTANVITMVDEVGDVARTWLAAIAPAAPIAVRTNGREAMAALAAAGAGIACLPRIVGDAMPALCRIPTVTTAPEPQLWLGVHRDARDVPRVRAVIRLLTEQLRQLQPRLAPDPR